MKKFNLFLILFVVLSFCSVPLRADIVWTEGHHEINDSFSYPGEIYLLNDCTLDITGGNAGRLAVVDTTITNWYGGRIVELWTRDYSVINIYGGQLESIGTPGLAVFSDQSIVNLYAYDVAYHSGQLTGKYYMDNSQFVFVMGDKSYLHINIVPEPTTFLLFALGGVFLRKKR